MTRERRPGRRSAGGLAARVVIVAASLLLLAEIGVRLVTWWSWRAPLARHPEIARRLESMSDARAHLTARSVMESPDRVPVPVIGEGDEPPRWTTFGQLEADAFVRPPARDEPTPGVVRVALVGDSVTFDGYPERLAEQLQRRFSERVEVLNLGVPSSTAWTTDYLMSRFLPRWRPHIVVVYTGRNDIYLGTAWARVLVADATGAGETELFLAPTPSRGLRELLAESFEGPSPFDGPGARSWEAEAPIERTIDALWALHRLGWELGADVYVSTYAAPNAAELDEEARDLYETEIRYAWPLLHDLDTYLARVATLNERIREMGRSGVGVVDVAAHVQGGRETFRDICHHTQSGKHRHARAVLDVISPRIAELLEVGALPPMPHAAPPSPVPAALPDALPTSGMGTCVRGPCPEDACFVPAGRGTYGYDAEVIDEVMERARSAYGFAHRQHWFGDDEPSNELRFPAFCIQRTEAVQRAHAECVEAGACPPYAYPQTASEALPAIFPTFIDAERFCAWRGGRLPTDARWERAARGMGRLLPWGDRWEGPEANFCGPDCQWRAPSDPIDPYPDVAPVGSTAASPFGATEMAGNLWEWTADCFHDRVHRFMPAGAIDPIMAPMAECRHVLRGGSHRSMGGFLERRTAAGLPDTAVPTRGVRCVFDFGAEPTPVHDRGVGGREAPPAQDRRR